MATIIKQKQTEIVNPTRTFKIGQSVTFKVQVPEQGIGWTYINMIGEIVKINRKTIDVLDNKYGRTYRVNINEIK